MDFTPEDQTKISACKSGNIEIIQYLIEAGKTINPECLNDAIKYLNINVVNWIMEEFELTTNLLASVEQ